MDGRRRRRIKEGFDLGVGFLGFFTAAFCIITLITELTHRDALSWALTTVVLGVGVAVLWGIRQSVLRRIDAQPAEDDLVDD